MSKNSFFILLFIMIATNIAFADYGPGDMSEEYVLYDNPNPLMVETSDAHTDESIPNYQVTKGGFFDDSYLKYKTPDNTQVQIQAKDVQYSDYFTTQKTKDRYTFTGRTVCGNDTFCVKLPVPFKK